MEGVIFLLKTMQLYIRKHFFFINWVISFEILNKIIYSTQVRIKIWEYQIIIEYKKNSF